MSTPARKQTPKWAFVNAWREKLAREGRSPKRTSIESGQRFGKLVALENAGLDDRGNRRWLFECDCGARLTWRVSTVTYNLRRLGWCSCPACYFAGGGWMAIAALGGADVPAANDNQGARE